MLDQVPAQEPNGRVTASLFRLSGASPWSSNPLQPLSGEQPTLNRASDRWERSLFLNTTSSIGSYAPHEGPRLHQFLYSCDLRLSLLTLAFLRQFNSVALLQLLFFYVFRHALSSSSH